MPIPAAHAAADARPAVAGGGWRARLELDFAPRGGRTVLVRRSHSGPLMVQSPFYPQDGACHVYVLHPPGGLVGGNELDITVHASSGSHVLLTTPAAGKFYRSDGPVARLTQQLHVARDAALEWLPGESIVFQGARCEIATRIDLDAGARLLSWEAWVLGRPACGEGFASGALRQQQDVRIDGRPVLVERNDARAGSRWLAAPWGLGGHAAGATLLAYPGCDATVQLARCAAGAADGVLAAVTVVDGLLVCRALAGSLLALRTQLERWWRALRPSITGRVAVAPRVWAT